MMNGNYVLICLFGILTSFSDGTVAHEAIVGGILAERKPFRYMVSLLQVGHGHLCGAALLNKQHILTAAHCFINPDNSFKSINVFAIAGTNDLTNTLPAVNIEVAKIYVPKEYNASDINTTGDIAVLKLKDPVQIAYVDNLKTIKVERNQEDNHSGQKAIVAGWGWNKIELKNNKEVGFRTDALLRSAIADVLSHQQCEHEHPYLKIYAEHLCAKVEQRPYELRGACHGDDGSPLVRDGFVIGVLSKFSHNCAERASSAIYTRVSHYLTFIRNSKWDYVTDTMREHLLLP